jgi:hypothetical protein
LSSQAERSATALFFADEFNATFNPRFPVRFQEFMAVQVLPQSDTTRSGSLSPPSTIELNRIAETNPGDAIHPLLHDPLLLLPPTVRACF